MQTLENDAARQRLRSLTSPFQQFGESVETHRSVRHRLNKRSCRFAGTFEGTFMPIASCTLQTDA